MDDAPAPTPWRDLRVMRSQWLAEDILGLSLADPGGTPLPPWTPGAHIDIALPSGQIRSYSLCGTPGAPRYDIAVLLERDGRGGSREIHGSQLVGRSLRVRTPRNDFPLQSEAAHHLFVAGGIGITPILPMIRALADQGRGWTLYFLARQRARMAFLPEIAALTGGTVHLFARDDGRRAVLGDALAQAPVGSHVYCCGPAPLLKATEAASKAQGLPYRSERFGRPDLDKPARAPAAARPDQGTESEIDPDGPFEVEMRATGVTLTVGPGQTILGEARKQRQGLSFNCSDGYCGTCETAVIAGRPDHRDSVLSEEERAENDTMMICVGRARTRKLVLDL